MAEADEPTPHADAGGAPLLVPASVRHVSLADVGLDAQAMDPNADPCTDFYQYACGGWMQRADVLEDRERHSRIDELERHARERVRTLLEARPAADPLGQVYRQCMDSAAIEQAGLVGVTDLLSAIRGIRRLEELGPVLATLHRHGIFAGFALRVARAETDPSRAVLVVEDAELGMPTRRHYLDAGAEAERLRRGYRDHVARIFELAGASRKEAEKAGREVLRIETELARVAETQVLARRVERWFREVDRAHLQATAGVLDWSAHLDALGWPPDAPVAVVSDEYLARMNELVRAHGAKGIARYLEWRLLAELTSALPPAFHAEKHAFHALLRGREPSAPQRWQVCVAVVDQAFGDVLARAYAQTHLPDSERRVASLLIDSLRTALIQRITERSWLGDTAKTAARAKLLSMTVAVGEHSDPADDMRQAGPGAEVRTVLAATILAARARAVRRELAHALADGPAARLLAHRVDGFYDPRTNRLALSAALLAPPFFAARRSAAVNLGALAATAGHQLIHAVDDLGQRYDAAGVLGPSWQPADEHGYAERARCLTHAYQGIQPAERPPLTRTQDMREDIADLGGVAIAYRALVQTEPAAVPLTAGGLDERQQFFVGAAQAVCEVEGADTSAPDAGRASARVRLNRALSQLSGFADAFQCPEQSPMRAPAENICDIW